MLIIFLSFFLIIGLISIIVLNGIAIYNYNQGLQLNIINTAKKCTPSTTENLEKATICQNDASKEFVSKDGILYEVGNNPKQYIQVCSDLCSGDVDTTGKCQKTNSQYDSCIKLLKPDTNCSNVANPISYIENNLLYAQKILTVGC